MGAETKEDRTNKSNKTMQKIWFVSDTHFGHSNIIKHAKRPFKDVDHMNEMLIHNWNAVVKPGDTVYFLGDFAMMHRYSNCEMWFRRLNGHIFMLYGNHDKPKDIEKLRPLWHGAYKRIKVEGQKIVLFHYPIRSWQGIHKGYWHLHGHCHGNLPDPGGLICDVGVDTSVDICGRPYSPISFEELKSWMDQRKLVLSGDHHRPGISS